MTNQNSFNQSAIFDDQTAGQTAARQRQWLAADRTSLVGRWSFRV
jgi:hypothetical protein